MLLLAQTSPTPNAKLLARQWLALYKQGPRWVPPLIQTGFLANLFLAFYSPSNTTPPQTQRQTYFYTAAALLTFSILPLTFLHFEPGINGACKWKAEQLLTLTVTAPKDKEEDGNGGTTPPLLLPKKKGRFAVPVSVERHSASEASKRWAERTDMAGLVEAWAGINWGRVGLGVVAGGLSFWGLSLGW
jgi:hypothetical protein